MNLSTGKEAIMQTKETQNPCQSTEVGVDFSKEIDIAEGIRNRALENYKQISIDTWNIKHSVVRNYLWLSITFLATYFAFFSKTYEYEAISNSLYYKISLFIAIGIALIALVIGIRSMTGSSSKHPSDNFVEVFQYLTSNGYHQGNHYALLKEEIETIKQAIEEEKLIIHKRGLSMRWMNYLLIASAFFGCISVLIYFFSTT